MSIGHRYFIMEMFRDSNPKWSECLTKYFFMHFVNHFNGLEFILQCNIS